MAAPPAQRVVINSGACCTGDGCRISTSSACQGAFLGAGSLCPVVDCDADGSPDACDIALEISLDLDADGIPDECQVDCPPPCDAWRTLSGPVGMGVSDATGGGGTPAQQPFYVCSGTWHDFAAYNLPPDFFAQGSQAYGGRVCLEGVPIDPSRFSTADTLVARDVDPLPLNANINDVGYASTELKALKMRSKAPITVVINGQETKWNVEVGMSSQGQSQGWLSATKTHADGGEYDSVVWVQPRFVFQRVDEPATIKVLDTGEEFQPPLYFDGDDSPWLYDIGSAPYFADLTIQFVAGVKEDDDGMVGSAEIVEEEFKGYSVEHKVKIPGHDKGACCGSDGSCTITTEDACDGTFLGVGTQCVPTDACCLPDGQCTETTEACCSAVDGTFYPGEECDPLGACCMEDKTCVETTEMCCEDADGTFYADMDCGDTGACCLPDATCIETIKACCEDAGGTFYDELDCEDTGACCMPDSSCIETTEQCCEDAGGSFHPQRDCEQLYACCMPDASCLETTFFCCEDAGGNWLEGHHCEPVGACCLANGDCVDNSTLECCNNAQGDWQGEGSVCPGDCVPCEVELDPCPIDICVGDTHTFVAHGMWHGSGSPMYEWTVTGPGASKVTPQSQTGFSETFQVTALEKSDAQMDVTINVRLMVNGYDCGTASCSTTIAGVDIDECPSEIAVTQSADIHADAFWGHTAVPWFNWKVIDGDAHVDPDAQAGYSETFTVTGTSEGSVTVEVEFIKQGGAQGEVCDTDTCTFDVIGCDVDISCGKGGSSCVVLLNDDDDNGNSQADLLDPGGFADDELISVSLMADDDAVEWSLDFPSTVKVYKSNDRTDPITSGQRQPAPPPDKVYVEGVIVSEAIDDVPITHTVYLKGEAFCSKQITLTVLELSIDVPGDIDADTQETLVTGLFWPFFDPDLTEPVNGKSLEFKVRKNGGTVGTHNVSIVDGAGTVEFPTSTNPGDVYDLEVTFEGAKRVSDSFKIIPGQPASVEFQQNLVGTSYVDDHTDTMDVTVTVRDAYGNLVADGTNCDWILDESTSHFEGGEAGLDIDLEGGTASAVTLSPSLPENQKLILHAMPIDAEQPIVVEETNASLTGPAQLDIGSAQSGLIQLTTNAADGTPVFWTFSNGNTRTAETTVSGGTSSFTVSAAKGGGNHARVGPCYVTATVGDEIAWYVIDFVYNDPFYVEMEHFILSADRSTDGVLTWPLPSAQPVPGYPPPPQRLVSRPYYAETDVTVHGFPNTYYVVSWADPTSANWVQFENLDAQGRVFVDATGTGVFRIRSRATYPGTAVEPDFLSIEFVVTPECVPPLCVPFGPPQERREVITIVDHGWWATSWDGVTSFFGGDPDTVTGIGANVAGGMLIVGDIGSLLKNLWRSTGWSSKEPNAVEAALSSLGLATELAVGIGEVADAPITGVRAIVAAIGNTKFSDALVILLKRALANAQALPKFANFVTTIISNSNVFQVAEQVLKSEELVEAAVRGVDEFGDEFFEVLQEIGENAALGIPAAQRVTKALGAVSDDAIAAIKNSGKFDEAMVGLAKAMDNGLDSGLLKKILDNNFYDAAYTQADILIDLGKVADAEGFTRLANSLKNTGITNKGFLYELQVAAHYADQGTNATTVVSKYVKATETLTSTDIDLIIDGVYYQVKRSANAFGYGKAGLQKTKAWVAKAIADGAQTVKYVTQPRVMIPPKVAAWLAKKGIEIIRVSGS